MFWNNVKIALRNLKKNKGFAAINITGPAHRFDEDAMDAAERLLVEAVDNVETRLGFSAPQER